jgi:hypothetical protein
MSNNQQVNSIPTAVDDVRRIREEIAAQHQGNIREHMQETNRIFEEWRAKLKLRAATPPNDSRRTGTGN